MVLNWSCFVNFLPRKLVEQWFTWDHRLKERKVGCNELKKTKTRHLFCGEIWMNKMLFIHCLSRCVVFRGSFGSRVQIKNIYLYIYKPYYSPHFVSDHSINSCVSENCKNVKHGWVRGQTRQLETKQRSENLRWRELVKTVTTYNVFKTGVLLKESWDSHLNSAF